MCVLITALASLKSLTYFRGDKDELPFNTTLLFKTPLNLLHDVGFYLISFHILKKGEEKAFAFSLYFVNTLLS
jgi:hypothetical protein